MAINHLNLREGEKIPHPPLLAAKSSSPDSTAFPYRLAYSAQDAAALLGGISLRSLRRLEQRGLLTPSRGLRSKLYLRSDLLAYLEGTK